MYFVAGGCTFLQYTLPLTPQHKRLTYIQWILARPSWHSIFPLPSQVTL